MFSNIPTFVNVTKADWASQRLNVWFACKGEGKTALAEPLVFKEHEEMAICIPTAQIEPTQAQQLMDSLWNCGVRPSEGSGSAGQLAAVNRHLEDMRTLVFKRR